MSDETCSLCGTEICPSSCPFCGEVIDSFDKKVEIIANHGKCAKCFDRFRDQEFERIIAETNWREGRDHVWTWRTLRLYRKWFGKTSIRKELRK